MASSSREARPGAGRPAAKAAAISSAKAAVLIFLFSVVIYSNSLGGDFVYDDDYFIVKNVAIRSIGNIPLFFTSPSAIAFSELAQDVYRPVTAISYALNYLAGRLDTFGYHLVNVFFHGADAVLVFLLLWTAFGDLFLAFVTAMLFACHPVQTEVVSWISGRSSVLSLFFYLASFVAYIGALKGSGRTASMRSALSLCLFALALFSKEMAVTLPLLLVAYDVHFREGESWKSRALRYAPYVVLTVTFILIRSAVLGRVSQCGWWGGSPYNTLLTMSTVFVDYVRVLLFPARLCAFYVTKVYSCWADANVLSSIAAIILVFAALPVLYRRMRGASFAIWWFIITMLPVSNIVPIRALMAERFLYLPSIGFCLLAAICIERIGLIGYREKVRSTRMIAVALAALVVAAYTARTMRRNEDWKDAESITASILKAAPLNPWAYASLGAAYSSRERFAEAVKPLAKAIALSDSYFAPRSILGFCYLEMGRYDDAIRVLSGALKLKPDNLEALNSLGVSYANVNRYDDAIRQFRRSIEIDRTFVSAYINLGTAYDHVGDYERALAVYGQVERNTRSRQDIAIAYIRMGDVYIKMKLQEKARECYGKAAALCGRGMDDLRKVATDRLEANWKI
jgi:tetratricopeptide (TPR) repeat protein